MLTFTHRPDAEASIRLPRQERDREERHRARWEGGQRRRRYTNRSTRARAKVHDETKTRGQRYTKRQWARVGVEGSNGEAADEVPIMIIATKKIPRLAKSSQNRTITRVQ